MRKLVIYNFSFTLYPLLNVNVDRWINTSFNTYTCHRFGKGPFCKFSIPQQITGGKGLYIFVVNDSVRYLGRCLKSFPKRLSEYSNISPSNCVINSGQQTNCHVNTEINEAIKSGAKVEIGICPLLCNEDCIKAKEKQALNVMRKYIPFWNLSY